MHFALISKILGLLLVVFSFTMMPPVAVAYLYRDGSEGPFLVSFTISMLLGLALWLPFFRQRAELQERLQGQRLAALHHPRAGKELRI